MCRELYMTVFFSGRGHGPAAHRRHAAFPTWASYLVVVAEDAAVAGLNTSRHGPDAYPALGRIL